MIAPEAVILVTLNHVPATDTVPAFGPVVAPLVWAAPVASVPTTTKVLPLLSAVEVIVTVWALTNSPISIFKDVAVPAAEIIEVWVPWTNFFDFTLVTFGI